VNARANLERLVAPVLLGLLLLVLWQVVVVVAGVPAFLLPSPAQIAEEFVALWDTISGAMVATGVNSFVGLVVGGAAGVLMAVAASALPVLGRMVSPLVAGLAVVPIVALAPVLYTMLGADSEMARRVVVGITAFVPVFITTLRGLRQVRPVHRDLMRVYAASSTQTARTVTVPTALPFVFTGLRLASSLAVIAAIVAEYFGGPRTGIGSFITTAAAGSNYARAWAFVVGGIVLGLLFYAVALGLENLVRRRTAPGGGAA
jgi:NitT/TauT family transport system permease protein